MAESSMHVSYVDDDDYKIICRQASIQNRILKILGTDWNRKEACLTRKDLVIR